MKRGFRCAWIAEASAAELHAGGTGAILDDLVRHAVSTFVQHIERNRAARRARGSIDPDDRRAVAVSQREQSAPELRSELADVRRHATHADAIHEREPVVESGDAEKIERAVLEPFGPAPQAVALQLHG